jgi:hypothetical protein
MLPPLCLDVRCSHRVLDMCAAPGTKTSMLLDLMAADYAREQQVPASTCPATANATEPSPLRCEQSTSETFKPLLTQVSEGQGSPRGEDNRTTRSDATGKLNLAS